ncbi:MAG: phosphate ABC transporter permease subunit PstC [Burkholderiaceae bacterium]
MTPLTLAGLLLAMSAVAYLLGKRRAHFLVGGKIRQLQSSPAYYGLYVGLWCGLPALLLLALWSSIDTTLITRIIVSELPPDLIGLGPDRVNLIVNDIRNHVSGNVVSSELTPDLIAAADRYESLQLLSRALMTVVTLCVAIGFGVLFLNRLHAGQRARVLVERVINWALILCSSIAILTTVGIVLSVLFEAIRFFDKVPPTDFLFGTTWSPQTALRTDQVGSSGSFGAIPLFVGTLLISLIAMAVAIPVGLMSAIYLSEYASTRVRALAKPALEILAGVPTVVYGFFAALVVAPFFRNAGDGFGLEVSSESALAAGLVMGVMIIPFVSSLSDDVINAVPQSLRDGAYGMGATRSETIRKVVLPAALPGVVGSILLALSRAIGETMIVVMAAGLAANLTLNPLQAVTTVTVQIVTLLVGDQEFESAKTLAAFALGLMLFVVTLMLNVIALHIVRKYREQYD